jgi:hypothetical protein
MAPPRRLLAAIALVALIGTGCANAPAETGSGGGENPAAGGSPSTEPESNPAAEAGGDGNVAAEATPNPELKERFELARCMRENGVEDFPDPDDNGIIQYNGEDPEFTSAREKCRHISPRPEGHEGNGG